MPSDSSAVWRRRLGLELRKLREGAGLTIEDVATRLECSSSKISRIETAHVSATPRDVRDMLDLYQITGRQQDDLVELARAARRRSWLQDYRDLPFAALVGLEAAAATLRMYSVLNIPGLLQIEDYAQAGLRAIRPDLPDKEINRRVELRLARRRFLEQDDPLDLSVVLDEAVLHRPVGGIDVMRRQFDHLLKLNAQTNVKLQVLPFSFGAHAAMDGEFTIVGFRDIRDPDTVFIENTTHDSYLVEPDEVRRYASMFDRLQSASLRPAESAKFLVEMQQTTYSDDRRRRP